jgi:hypothetical protein
MVSTHTVVREWKEERSSSASSVSDFSIFVQDVPYYSHAAGSQASMIIGKILALINLRGVVSSQRLRGVVIDSSIITTLLATGRSYGKTPCPHHEGGNHLIVTIVKECAFQPSADNRHYWPSPRQGNEPSSLLQTLDIIIPAEFYSRYG